MQKSLFCGHFISTLHIHEFPIRMRMKIKKASAVWLRAEKTRIKSNKTHASSLIEWVVKFCLHSDLSVWMRVYKRKS